MISYQQQEDGRRCVIGNGLVLKSPQTILFPNMKKCSFAVIVSAKRIGKSDDFVKTIVRLTVYLNRTTEKMFHLCETLHNNERVSFKGVEITSLYKDPLTGEEKTTREIRAEEVIATERLAALLCQNSDVTTTTRKIDGTKKNEILNEEEYLF